jgi:hypothetical protein
MAHQPSTTVAPTTAAPAAEVNQGRGARFAWAGAVSGLIGGALGGGFGGGLAAGLADLGIPDVDHILRSVAFGALGMGTAAAVVGAPAGLLTARRGRRAARFWPGVATFWAGLPAAVEACQGDWLSAARTFLVGTAVLLGLLALADHVRPVLWNLRWLALGWLVLCLVGEAYNWLWPAQPAELAPYVNEPTVQLGSAPLPGPLGGIARHHYFLSFDPAEGRWHRWDLWQFPNRCPTCWGHVHRDLLDPDDGTGGGPPRLEREWHGDQARSLLAALNRSAAYPYRGRYVALPGPNCNAYVAWVLRESGVPADLDPRALGKDYLGPVGVGVTTTGTGVQAESTLLGAKVGLSDGVELHFLGFTFGLDAWPPAVKTPLGRFGFAE